MIHNEYSATFSGKTSPSFNLNQLIKNKGILNSYSQLFCDQNSVHQYNQNSAHILEKCELLITLPRLLVGNEN